MGAGLLSLRVSGIGLGFGVEGSGFRVSSLLKGSWDLVTGVINKATIVLITYNPPIKVLLTLLTKSQDPPSKP